MLGERTISCRRPPTRPSPNRVSAGWRRRSPAPLRGGTTRSRAPPPRCGRVCPRAAAAAPSEAQYPEGTRLIAYGLRALAAAAKVRPSVRARGRPTGGGLPRAARAGGSQAEPRRRGRPAWSGRVQARIEPGFPRRRRCPPARRALWRELAAIEGAVVSDRFPCVRACARARACAFACVPASERALLFRSRFRQRARSRR